jgi:2'-5' RNA ligase
MPVHEMAGPRLIEPVRCFVAVWPDERAVEALASLQRPPLEALRWSTPQQWHVTLRFLGDLTPPHLDELLDRLHSVAPAPGVVATGGPATRLLGPGLVIWPVSGLASLAGKVAELTADIGQPPADRPFLGHVTLARARRGADVRRLPGLRNELSASWPVRSIGVVQSLLRQQGAEYSPVAELAL